MFVKHSKKNSILHKVFSNSLRRETSISNSFRPFSKTSISYNSSNFIIINSFEKFNNSIYFTMSFFIIHTSSHTRKSFMPFSNSPSPTFTTKLVTCHSFTKYTLHTKSNIGNSSTYIKHHIISRCKSLKLISPTSHMIFRFFPLIPKKSSKLILILFNKIIISRSLINIIIISTSSIIKS